MTTQEDERAHGAYIPTLDGWRTFAVTLVLLDHAADAIVACARKLGLALPYVDHVYKEHLGRAGVHLFFSLSGYLITLRMLQEERSHGAVSLRNFYARRLFRIQPAALTYLAVVGALGLAQIVRVAPSHWWSALLCYANFNAAAETWYTGHFWSLSIEEHFYLLWPALFVGTSPALRLRMSLGLAAALSAWMFVLMKFQWKLSYFSVRTDFEAQWLVWGCVAALCSRSERGARVLGRLAHPLTRCLPLALPVLLAADLPIDWKLRHVMLLACAASTPLWFVTTSTRPGGLLGRLLELPSCRWLGRLSYSLYLWQSLFLVWANHAAPRMGALQTFPLGLLASLAAASLSHYFIEQPMIRLGRRFTTKRKHRAQSAEAQAAEAQASEAPRPLL